MAFTNLMLDKIKLDLADLTIANGHPLDIGAIVEGAIVAGKREEAMVAIRIGADGPGWATSEDEYTPQTGEAAQRFQLELYLKGTGRELADFSDAVRNVLERAGSNIQALNVGGQGTVLDAVCLQGDPDETTESHEAVAQRERITLEVGYVYTRGAL